MKSLFQCSVLILFLVYTASLTAAIEYATDLLEKGNLGGNTVSLKTFDKKGTKDMGKEITLDVWLKDVPEELISAGFWLSYDASKVSIVKIDVYDGTVLPGPWDREITKQYSNLGGPGTYMVVTCNLGCVKPDKKGDIIVAKVQCSCQDKCINPIEIKPIKDFNTVVGCEGKVFDATIKPATFTIHGK